ncbi:unannotated protein [freshwater metagenome]|uniref:Unannotated protein n=1 Tax=freshwater metagenome TaxID=449393 RepID=A0A6J6G2W4_9ZZZZ
MRASSRTRAGRVSGKRNQATPALINATVPATKNGRCSPPKDAKPPRAGPTTNPTPKAAPKSPNSRGRSLGGARSVTAPWATATLAPDAPSKIRPRKRTHNAPAAPVTNDPTAVPSKEIMITGLRPMRSERRPRSGAHTNCARENEAKSNPTSRPLAPKRSAYRPKIGTTIPKPTKSRATVTQIVAKPCGSGALAVFSERVNTFFTTMIHQPSATNGGTSLIGFDNPPCCHQFAPQYISSSEIFC